MVSPASDSSYPYALLSDPVKNRVVKDVKPPPHKPLSKSALFASENTINWKLLKDHQFLGGILLEEDLLTIIKKATAIFKSEANLLALSDPVTVVGDLHGQYYDLMKIFEIGGEIGVVNYLFLGDYVDRGSFGIEIIALLYSLKITYPKNFVLLRGNHESRQMTSYFNFKKECENKYSEKIYEACLESFLTLPIACMVNKKFLAVHGGFSPDLKTLDDIRELDRFQETPREGLLCDLIWADPTENDHGECSPPFKPNSTRSCSFVFGKTALQPFLKKNKVLAIIRAHESLPDGYKMHKWASDFPMVITVFSAPNYCDVYGNKGAIIKFDNNNLNIQQFNYSKHPYHLPDYMNVFAWSIPYLTAKVIEMLMAICKKGVEDEYPGQGEKVPAFPNKGEVMKNKVKVMSRLLKMYRTIQENDDLITQLKGLCPDRKIPRGLLLEGPEALRDAVERFQKAKEHDLKNEKRPK